MTAQEPKATTAPDITELVYKNRIRKSLKKYIQDAKDLEILDELISHTQEIVLDDVHSTPKPSEVSHFNGTITDVNADIYSLHDQERQKTETRDFHHPYLSASSSLYEYTQWLIQSPINQNIAPLLVLFVRYSSVAYIKGKLDILVRGTLSICPLTEDTDVSHLSKYQYNHIIEKDSSAVSDKINIYARGTLSNNNSSNDITGEHTIDLYEKHAFAKSLKKEDVEILKIEELTQDLLMRYIIALVEPELQFDVDTLIHQEINSGQQPSEGMTTETAHSENHIWFDLWENEKIKH